MSFTSPFVARTFALGIAFAGPSAHASECPAEIDVLSPTPGTESLPLNARIWVDEHQLKGSAVHLEGPMGSSIELQSRSIAIDAAGVTNVALHMLTPTTPLAPLTDYAAIATAADGQRRQLTYFTTGTETADNAPDELPLLDVNYDGAGLTRTLDLAFEPNPNAIVVLHFGENPTEQPWAADRGVSWAATASQMHFTNSTNCGPWPSDLDEVDSIHFGQLDTAGRFSGWSETKVLESGCSMASGDDAPTALMGLGLLALLGLARRRSPRGTR